MKKWLKTLKKVGSAAADNVGFLLGALACVAAVLAIAVLAETLIRKAHAKKGDRETEASRESFKLRRMTLIAMLLAQPSRFIPAFTAHIFCTNNLYFFHYFDIIGL